MKVIPTLEFVEALKSAGNNILNFKGRARRSEYWWTILAVYLFGWVFGFVTPFAYLFISLALIPLTFRRLHDTGRSGWWWGIYLIIRWALVFSAIFDIFSVGFHACHHACDFPSDGLDMLLWALAKYSIWVAVIFIYRIVLVILMCIDSDRTANRFGPSPKYVDDEPQF